MNNKSKNIMSLSMETDLQDVLKRHAKRKGISVSKLVRDLVEKFLVTDDEVVPVILKIPNHLKGDEPALREWMESRSNAIVKALAAQ